MVRRYIHTPIVAMLALLIIPSLSNSCLAADDPHPIVSLILKKATVEKNGTDTLFRCEVTLDNDTGNELTVLSNFYSAFDGMEIVVTNLEGKTLAQQGYTFHQSPFTPTSAKFNLQKGATTKTLVFPIQKFPDEPKSVKVRIVGKLYGSDFDRILSTETTELRMK